MEPEKPVQPELVSSGPASASGVLQKTTSPAETSIPQDIKPFAPPLGSRIEVLWRITYDDTEPVVRWWGATVQDVSQELVGDLHPPNANLKVYVLLYDAHDGFAEDIARVAFVSPDTLLDLACVHDENKGILDWRIEEESEANNNNKNLSLDDVLRDEMDRLREAGVTENADLEVLGEMPAHVQSNITAGYRNFVEGVKEMIGECMRKNPPGYVVTEQDVRQMYAKMLAKQKGVSI